MTKGAMLELSKLSRHRDGVVHLDGLTHQFERGKLYTLLGPTGAGKTTLLRSICGLEQVDSGVITLQGQDLGKTPPWKRPIAMVYQQFINYPHLTALENVAFPLIRSGTPKAQARARAQELLQKVQLGHLTDRRPGALSGGQQQRVAIARALAKNAPVLLLDEPFVNLDYKLREELRVELVELLAGNDQMTVIYATTEPREALQLGDQVLVMDKGRLLQVSAPEALFEAPCSVDVAQVTSDPPINILPFTQRDGVACFPDLGDVAVPEWGAGLADGSYFLGLRAGGLYPAAEGYSATVRLTEVNGSETLTFLDLGATELTMHEREVRDHAIGDKLTVAIRTEDALLFNAQGQLVDTRAKEG